MSRPIVFLDTETTSTLHTRHPWEIAMILRAEGRKDRELVVYIDVADLDLKNADPKALKISRFHERHPQITGDIPAGAILCSEQQAAARVLEWTAGARVAGVNPHFDLDTLEPMLRRHNLDPRWYFMPLCVATEGSGFVKGRGIRPGRTAEAISRQCGVEPPAAPLRHSALGDALWAMHWLDQLDQDLPQNDQILPQSAA